MPTQEIETAIKVLENQVKHFENLLDQSLIIISAWKIKLLHLRTAHKLPK
jgi:hypothetical protein